MNLVEELALLTPEEVNALLQGPGRLAIKTALQSWRAWARPSQLEPPGVDWATWLIMAGRGGGKTRTGAEWVTARVRNGLSKRIALVGATSSDVRDTMIEGESGILACARGSWRPHYQPSKRRLTWPNGAIATTFSAEEPDRLRGPQHDGAWCDEVAAWKYPESYDMLMFGMRLGVHPRVCITTTPKPIPIIRDILKNPRTVVTRYSTYENLANLAPTFRDQILRKYEGTRLGRQELEAELLEDIEGALWRLGLIELSRMTPDDFARVEKGRTVVAIDPSVTANATSDECGIVVATRGIGLCPCGKQNCCYVLEDLSGRVPSIVWAGRAIKAYKFHNADRVVAEVNNGGDLVESQLRVVDQNIPYRAVHASKGKRTRAEPVEALYEQGRVHHVGMFPRLEDEMTTWVPDVSPSPNRVDALVWALTAVGLDSSTGIIEFYEQEVAAMRNSQKPSSPEVQEPAA